MELAVFGIVPGARSIAGIVVTCLGVALVVWRVSTSRPPGW
jgi:hypothetical protein